jgi:nitrogen fixation-related uncharacterized protein
MKYPTLVGKELFGQMKTEQFNDRDGEDHKGNSKTD